MSQTVEFLISSGCTKQGTAVFEHAVRQANCAPNECLFIDDLPANIDGAIGCGLQGVVYSALAYLVRQPCGSRFVFQTDLTKYTDPTK